MSETTKRKPQVGDVWLYGHSGIEFMVVGPKPCPTSECRDHYATSKLGGFCGRAFANGACTFLRPGDSPAERDWSRWLPPHKIPDTAKRPEEGRVGQVYAARWGALDYQARVWRCDEEGDVLLAGHKIFTGAAPRQDGGYSYKNALLVQDVGQAEPTPPEVLYAPAQPSGGAQGKPGCPRHPEFKLFCCDCREPGVTEKPPIELQAPSAKVKPRPTYESLKAELEAEEGVPAKPTCRRCRATVAKVNEQGQCLGCYAKGDDEVQALTAAVQYKFKPYVAKPEPWRPSCDEAFWIPGPTEFGS